MRLVGFQNHRNPPLETLEAFLDMAKEAGAVATSDNLYDIRLFHKKIGSKLFLMQGMVLRVEYGKMWRILADRSPTDAWFEVFEALKQEVGLRTIF